MTAEVCVADEKPAIEITPVRKRGKGKGLTKKQQVRAIELAASGLPVNAVAKTIGAAPSTTARYIQKFQDIFKELDNVEDYRQGQVDILDASKLAVLKNLIKDEKLAKAGVKELAYAFDRLNHHRRLEAGQATSHTVTMRFTGNSLDKYKSDANPAKPAEPKDNE